MIENQLRLVSSVSFSDFAVGADHVEAHAGDADDEIVVAVEGEAERAAADMGEDLPLLMIGTEEAHDVAVTVAAIEMPVAVDNHVLRPLDLGQADHLDIARACRSARRASPVRSSAPPEARNRPGET